MHFVHKYCNYVDNNFTLRLGGNFLNAKKFRVLPGDKQYMHDA